MVVVRVNKRPFVMLRGIFKQFTPTQSGIFRKESFSATMCKLYSTEQFAEMVSFLTDELYLESEIC